MENAFDLSMIRGVRGLGQDVSGEDSGGMPAASTTSDQGNSLFSTATGGTSQLLGSDGSDPTYSGETIGSGGTSGGGAIGGAASSTGTSAGSSLSSALSSLTSGGNLPLLIGAGVLVLGVAGVAYYAHEHQTGGGGGRRRTSSFGRRRSYARRRR